MDTILTTLTLDTTALDAAVARLTAGIRTATASIAERLTPILTKTARAFASMVDHVTERCNDPVYVAGVEARMYVRAGMDPAYAAPADLDRLIRDICSGDAHDVMFMSPANRLVVATAVMRGWAEHHHTDVPVLAWYRLIGTTRIAVTRSVA